MAEYRTVRMTFWHDPYIEELDAKAKLLYLYLFTCPYANNLGVIEATRRKIAYETALSQNEIDKCLDDFQQAGKVVCDLEHNLIFLTNFIKHQTSTSPKILDGLMILAPKIPSPIIAKALCIRYPEVYGVKKDDGDTLSIPYADGIRTLSIPSGEIGSWKGEIGRGKGEEEDASGIPPCPHQKIVAAYHEALPELSRVKIWQGTREMHLQSRWRERFKAEKFHDEASGIDYFQRFFDYIRGSPFLMGQRTGRDGRTFRADLAWLVNAENFAKTIEGKYHDDREMPA